MFEAVELSARSHHALMTTSHLTCSALWLPLSGRGWSGPPEEKKRTVPPKKDQRMGLALRKCLPHKAVLVLTCTFTPGPLCPQAEGRGGLGCTLGWVWLSAFSEHRSSAQASPNFVLLHKQINWVNKAGLSHKNAPVLNRWGRYDQTHGK